jgi:hypothetical protein
VQATEAGGVHALPLHAAGGGGGPTGHVSGNGRRAAVLGADCALPSRVSPASRDLAGGDSHTPSCSSPSTPVSRSLATGVVATSGPLAAVRRQAVQRQKSLKNLLSIDRYDFVRDVSGWA